jgi:hypothetical protein
MLDIKGLRNYNYFHGNFFSYILQWLPTAMVANYGVPIKKNGDYIRPTELRISRAIPHKYIPELTISSITWLRCEFKNVWDLRRLQRSMVIGRIYIRFVTVLMDNNVRLDISLF